MCGGEDFLISKKTIQCGKPGSSKDPTDVKVGVSFKTLALKLYHFALWRLSITGEHWTGHSVIKLGLTGSRRIKSIKLKENVGNTYPLVFCWASSWDACLEAGVSTLSEAHSGCHLEDHARNGLKFHITEDYFRKKAKPKSIHFPLVEKA